jgi:hypothetical protein
MKFTNILLASVTILSGASALDISAPSNRTTLITSTTSASSTAPASTVPETTDEPTPTTAQPFSWASTAITAGVSPKWTHPPGYGEALNYKAVAFSKKVQPVLDYVLTFPFILVAAVAWLVLAPMAYRVLREPHMMNQWVRGCQQNVRNVAITEEERARGKMEREEERSEKKKRQMAEMHMAPVSEIQDKVVEKNVFAV